MDKEKPRDCFYDKFDPPVFFELTITNFKVELQRKFASNTRKTKKTFKDKVVKTGADFVRLNSDHVEYSTTSLKTEDEVNNFITKFYPKLSSIGKNRSSFGK